MFSNEDILQSKARMELRISGLLTGINAGSLLAASARVVTAKAKNGRERPEPISQSDAARQSFAN